MKTDIKILHSACCATGSPIKGQIEKVAAENHIPVTIEELSDMADTMVYGTMAFPSIVVNGTVHDYRTVTSEDQLVAILKSA